MGKKIDWAIGGGALGWIIGGPIGGAIGGFLGYLLSPETIRVRCPYCHIEMEIDPNEGILWTCSNCRRNFIYDPMFSPNNAIKRDDEDYRSSIQFIIHVLLCGFVAKLDGRIDYAEKEALKEFFKMLDVDPQSMDYIIAIFDSDITNKMPPEEFWRSILRPRLLTVLSDASEEEIDNYILSLFSSFFYIANSSPPILPQQELFILNVAKSLGLPENFVWEIKNNVLNFTSLKDHSDRELEEAYEILGLSYDASCEEIKSAYRKNVVEIHPDKYSNLPQPVRQVLNEKLQKLNRAYDLIIKHKNCHKKEVE